MKPWMMALVFGRRPRLVTVVFSANTVWPAPSGLAKLDTVVGRGGTGTPGGSGSQSYSYETTTVFDLVGGGQASSSSSGSGSGPIPGPSGCSYTNTPGSTYSTGYTSCTFYTDTSSGGSSPTTGASATGFGLTFPGGLGGPATPATYGNVPVTPGASYAITVPAGASITISYYV